MITSALPMAILASLLPGIPLIAQEVSLRRALPNYAAGETIYATKTGRSFGSFFFQPDSERIGRPWGWTVTKHKGCYYGFFMNTSPRAAAAGLPWDNISWISSADGAYWDEGDVLFHGKIGADVHVYDFDGRYILYPTTTYGAWKRFWNDSLGSLPETLNKEPRQLLGIGKNAFAASTDLKTWEVLPFADGTLDYREYSKGGRLDTMMRLPTRDAEGAYTCLHTCGALKDGRTGYGLFESRDGVRFDPLPPAIIEDVPFFFRKGTSHPGESNGFVKIGETYFIYFRATTHPDEFFFLVKSDSLHGPYTPAKNFVFSRGNRGTIYSHFLEEDGWVTTPTLYGPNRCILPLARLFSDGEGLWEKWWEGNNALKRVPIDVSLRKEDSSIRWVDTTFDLEKGVILEAKLAAGGGDIDDANLLAEASFEGSPAWDTYIPKAFSAKKTVDGELHTFWYGLADDKNKVRLQADLGAVAAVGRVGIAVPSDYGPREIEVALSEDGGSWEVLPETQLNPIERNLHRLYENLGLSGRYLRLTMKGRQQETKKDMNPPAGCCIQEIGVYAKGQVDLSEIETPGLVCEFEGGKMRVVLFNQDGTVDIGEACVEGRRFNCFYTRDLHIPPVERTHVRLLHRGNISEIYVNDFLVATLDAGRRQMTNRIGFVGCGHGNRVSDLNAWSP